MEVRIGCLHNGAFCGSEEHAFVQRGWGLLWRGGPRAAELIRVLTMYYCAPFGPAGQICTSFFAQGGGDAEALRLEGNDLFKVRARATVA